MINLKFKKGTMVLTFIAFMSVAAIAIFFYYYTYQNVEGKTVEYIGDEQFTLIQSQFAIEKHLFLVDEGARLSGFSSVFEMALNGGFDGISPCGTYEGYNLWSTLDKDCFPSKKELENNFINIFKTKFVKYRNILRKKNLLVSYDYFYENGDVIGIASSNFLYNFTNYGLIRKVNPSFRENIGFDLNNFLYLTEFVNSLNTCEDYSERIVYDKIPEQCIQTRIKQFNQNYPNIKIFIDECGSSNVKLSDTFEFDKRIKFCARFSDNKFLFFKEGESSLLERISDYFTGDLKVKYVSPDVKFAVTLKKSDLISPSKVIVHDETFGFKFDIPSVNYDGSSITDKNLILDILFKLKPSNRVNCDVLDKDYSVLDKISVLPLQKGLEFNIKDYPFVSGQSYCVAIVLRDLSGNPKNSAKEINELTVIKEVKY